MQQYSTGKRVGYFFLALSAFMTALAIQIGIAVLFVIVALVQEMMVSGNAVFSSADAYMKTANRYATETSFVAHFLSLIVFAIWYKFMFKKPRPTIRQGLKKLSIAAVIVAIFSGLALCFFNYGVVFLEYLALPDVYENYIQMTEMAELGENAWSIIAVVILAPINEELIFRGVTLEFGRRSIKWFWIANILQSFLFALLHMNLVQGAYAFFLGLAMGWIVKETGTVLSSILLHFVVNLSASTWTNILMGPIEEPTYLLSIMMTGIPWLAVIPSMLWMKNRIQKRREKNMPLLNEYGA